MLDAQQNRTSNNINSNLSQSYERLKSEREKADNVDDEMIKIKAQTMYAHVYHGIALYFKLSPIENLLLATVFSLTHKKGYAYASQKSYAVLLNVTPTTINTTYRKLQKKNLLEKCGKSMFGTTGWRTSAEFKDRLEYIKKQIDRASHKRT